MLIKKLILIATLCFTITPRAYANFDNAETQKAYFELGYESVYDSLERSNMYFKHEIHLPVQIPPIPFTHVVGRLNKHEDRNNSTLEIEYINQNGSPYGITIFPLKSKVQLSELDSNAKIFTLKDGSKAGYITKPPNFKMINHFYFEKNGWQYLFRVHPEVSNVITPELLVEIADSIK